MQAVIMEDLPVNENLTTPMEEVNNNIIPYPVPEVPNTYDDLFPALPESATPSLPKSKDRPMRIERTVVTQVFCVPFEERKFDSEKFGEGESMRTCQSIMKDTGAHIEISSGKDQSLTFLVTGRTNEVLNARRKILIHYQTQASKQIHIPKEHHRWILGKKGERLREIEKQTATKINVPNIAEESDIITISGTKNGIEKAEHEIQTMSDEQSKKAFELIAVPKIYHPFIMGPFNENLQSMIEQTGARINIPPPSVMKNEISITGEKENVNKAKQMIENIWRDMEKKCTTVSVEVPKAQHRYVIGSRGSTIQEILQLTGVSVEMPPSDSDNDTVTLRGLHEKLGLALTTVYEKANSVRSVIIDAPGWIHKYIIGRKGVNIKEISAEFPVVHVEFIENNIKIEGPPDQVEKARANLENVVADYVNRLTFIEMTVHPRHYKHIIGKAGANVNRLKEELDVIINIEEKNGDNRIRIEGPIEGVRKAEQELTEKIDKLENEKEKDVIIDHRLFSTLIGSKGENIREIRDKFRMVQIIFPNSVDKTDIVKLRGPKDEVDKCHKHLLKMVKDLQDSSFVMEVPIFKQFHKFIIGKGGANIKKIRDETQTKIELPAEGDNNEMIVISGKEENVIEARNHILKIQSELADIVTEEITIPPKFYNSIIGTGGKLISSVMEDCGGVSIKFPNTDSKSDKVTIRGPKEDVEKAKLQLLELSNERQMSSFSAEVRAKPQHHKFLIGKNGASVKRIRDNTNTRIVFPGYNDEDKESIVILGKEENVLAAKAQLESIIKDIDNIVEGEVAVDIKYHKHFVARRGEILHRISDDFGGVMISFPRPGVDSDRVTLKGPKECIELAKQRILEIVSDLDAQITIDCIISQRHHRTVMGARGVKVQLVSSDFDVQIKFPDRDATDVIVNANGEPAAGTNTTTITTTDSDGIETQTVVESSSSSIPAPIRYCDVIRITGRADKCELARQALINLIPITTEIEVPFDLHRSIIGQKGRDVRELMSRYDVHIELSPPEQRLDIIKITGTPLNVEEAIKAIGERVEELELDRKDRELRSYELRMEVDPEWHPKIIGRKGAIINKIRADHQVQISFPRREDSVSNVITIQGYEANANAAKEEILKIVGALSDLTREVLEIDARVHPRLIGQRGRNIRKLMDDYKVEIKFPRNDDENPNAVTIIGAEENVLEAKDVILSLEEEFLDDVVESVRKQNDLSSVLETALSNRNATSAGAKDAAAAKNGNSENGGGGGGGGGNRHEGGGGGGGYVKKHGFVVQGAPWEGKGKAPNTSSQEDFPDFGITPTIADNSASLSSAWGQRR